MTPKATKSSVSHANRAQTERNSAGCFCATSNTCTPCVVLLFLVMKGEIKERWMLLCEQAANEQDPQKLLALVREINELLEAKERRLGILPPNNPSQD